MTIIILKRLQHKKVADGCLKGVEPESLLKQVSWRWEIVEKSAP